VNVFHSLRLGSPRLADADSARLAEDTGAIERSGCALSERVLLLLGGVKVCEAPRFAFSFAVAGLLAVLAAELFISLLDAGVPALGFPAAADVPRDSVVPGPAERAPAATGEKWFCCMDCCK
jgi:hypothetical protein